MMKMNIALIVVLLLLNSLFAQNNGEQNWQVGTARIEITPGDTLWMAGYASRNHPADGILHPLWAKAMSIQDKNGNQGVIITTDLLGFPNKLSEAIKKRCKQKYNLSKAQIILSSSHTHTGPVLQEALYDIYPLTDARIERIEHYSQKLVTKIVNLVGESLENKNTVFLSSNNGVVRFQVNRRNNNSSTLSSQSDLNGPNDYAVPVIQAHSFNGTLTSVLFGYACHPTVLNGYQWSGDYPGFAQIELENEMPGTTAMFFQGCGADQNPLPRRTVGLAKQYGLELAAAVQNVNENPTDTLSSDLHMVYEEIELELASPPQKAALQNLATNGQSYQQRWAKRILERIENGEQLETSYPYPIQVWRIGEQPLFVLGGEVVVDYAIELKRIFGEKIFVMGYANDVMSYIPSARILREGGYEGLSSQIVYGLPAAWNASIENNIIHACIELADKVGVNMPEAELVSE